MMVATRSMAHDGGDGTRAGPSRVRPDRRRQPHVAASDVRAVPSGSARPRPKLPLLTRRLRLRRIRRSDATAFAQMFHDPEVHRYLSRRRARESGLAFVRRAGESARAATAFRLVVEDRRTRSFVGTVGLVGLDWEEGHAELVYSFRREVWGRGYATEAGARVVRWAFGELKLHRLGAGVTDGNVRSVRVLRKLGFRPEGRRRQARRSGSMWVDDLEFGLVDGRRP